MTSSNAWDLEDVVLQYLKAVDAGQSPRREEWLAKYPEYAGQLAVFFDCESVSVEPLFLGLATRGRHDELNDLVGQSIGPYRLMRLIGQGGMGTVFEAQQDAPLKRRVALKIIKPGMDSAQLVRRFEAERQSLAVMNHANVAKVLDAGTISSETASQELREKGIAEGRPYFVMELVLGAAITRYCDEAKLDYRQRLELIVPVCDGIHHAHQLGIVHRDLKPSNVLVTVQDGRPVPKIIDFGLAKFTEFDQPFFSDAGRTLTGQILGTPAYMSPEQASGNEIDVGRLADVYSLGAILYEILTSRPPFVGSTSLEILRKVQCENPERIRKLLPDLPIDIATICHKCLEKLPHERYESALAVAEDIQRYLSGKLIHARPVSSFERLWRWCHGNPRSATLSLLVIILMFAVTIVSAFSAVSLKAERDRARESQKKTEQAQRGQRAELYRAYLSDAKVSRQTRTIGQRDQGLESIRKIIATVPSEELRDEQWVELRDAAIASMALVDLRIRGRAPQPTQVADFFHGDIDPAVGMYARFNLQAGATEIGLLDNGEASTLGPAMGSLSPSEVVVEYFDPYGRWLLEIMYSTTSSKRTICVWDCRTREWSSRQPFESAGISIPGFDPIEPRFLTVNPDATLRIYELPSCRELRRSPARFRRTRISMSPDGKFAAVAGQDQPAQIVDLATWETIKHFPEARGTTAVKWSPTGDFIIFGDEQGRLYLVDCERNYMGQELNAVNHLGAVTDIQISPNGKMIASSGSDNQCLVRLRDSDQYLFHVRGKAIRFGMDNRTLAIVDGGKVAIRELTDYRAYLFARRRADGVEFSPDGQWLAVGGIHGPSLLSSKDLSELAQFGMDTCGPITFDPGGKELLTFGLFSQVWRWPITRTMDDSEITSTIGPAQRAVRLLALGLLTEQDLLPQHQGRHAIWNADGTKLVVADYRHGRVLMGDKTTSRVDARPLGDLLNVSRVAISPDNAWIAGSATKPFRVRVWPSQGGPPVLDLPYCSNIAFSADGQWFSTASPSDIYFFRTGTWERVRVIPRQELDIEAITPVAFQPHGSLAAFMVSNGLIRLYDFEFDRIVAHLTDPEQGLISALTFSPDGTRLAFGGQKVGIWDLSELRLGLESLGIDASALPHRSQTSAEVARSISVIRGSELPAPDQWSKNWLRMARSEMSEGNIADAIAATTNALDQLPAGASPHHRSEIIALRGEYHFRGQNYLAARDDWQAALALDPDSSSVATKLARLCLLGPPSFRDEHLAMSLVSPLYYRPEPERDVLLLMGVALGRIGHCEEALDLIQKVSSEEVDPITEYVLADVLHHLGRDAEARIAFDKAKTLHEQLSPNLGPAEKEELRILMAGLEGLR